MNRVGLLRDAVIEASRIYLAALLRFEKAAARNEESGDLEIYRDDALQDLRDALAAERKSR